MVNVNWIYRDQKVKQSIIDRYKAGESLIELAFVDATKFQTGLLSDCNLRYLILSNMGHDWSLINDKANRLGLIVFQHGLTWKILDKYELNGATQILLSPDDDIGNYPTEDIISSGRKHFDELRGALPLPVLNTTEFKDRLFFPIGFNDEGVPHNLTK